MDKLQQLVAELKDIGWLEQTEEGPSSRIRYLELGNQGSAYHIRSIHRKTIERALWSLDHQALEDRYFYSAFFTMEPARAKLVADKLRSYVLALAEDELPPRAGQEVYTIGTFLVPLTQSTDVS